MAENQIMPDTARRTALATRSRALRNTANALMEKLKDDGIKSMLRVSVLHPLDDVDCLFLGDPPGRPSLETHEDMWLDNTSFVLSRAEQEFDRLSELIGRFGGPDRAVTIGQS